MLNNRSYASLPSPVPIGGHKLPPLRYSYDALEPVIDAETLRIHHDKHHGKYVDDLNKAELAAQKMRLDRDYSDAGKTERSLAFNGSGHILHSVYWTVMTYPDRGGSPGRLTAALLAGGFGGIEEFFAQFNAAAAGIYGSGWGILAYNQFFGRLEILTAERHENLTQWGSVPILVCDVWEHAYYLKYKNERAAYIAKWRRLINWGEVENRLARAAACSASII